MRELTDHEKRARADVPRRRLGDPCPTCDRPLDVLGLEHCSRCGAAHVDYQEQERRRHRKLARPWGVVLPGEGWKSIACVARGIAGVDRRG